ncbi:hypothetical protein OUY22_16740 [Nonomuraea sp. MCN248]|uniref:Uncharacterized protein n=1 Tax=Nonomuraea corallina TaxID=2989783 RepID=A0ABT4SCY2_9ACTN|nr:hypothetical protein [Nonomuraea corallina]MDA0635068.1 hypothetical protein [Nonomuraea corallina]
MRRYRFGRVAAVVAGGFVVAVVVSGAVAVVTDEAGYLWTLTGVLGGGSVGWATVLPVVALGVLQGWGLWQILRGRSMRGKAESSRDARLLRVVLYASLVLAFVPSPWWVDLLEDALLVALVVVFYRVLDRASTVLRTAALVAGVCGPVVWLADVGPLQLFGLPWLVWMVLTLAAQERDGRWSRVTVWSGAASAAEFFLPVVASIHVPDGLAAYYWFSIGNQALEVLGLVWLARTAHELGSRPEEPAPGRGPGPRGPWRSAFAGAVTVAVLVLVPVSDHAPGPVTTARACERAEEDRRWDASAPPLTGELTFVCEVRTSGKPSFAQGMPDGRLIVYGHRLCGAYTRADQRELAGLRASDGLDPADLATLLAGICPRAAATLKAAAEAEQRELLAWVAAEQRVCAKVPRHRPLIKPVKATVVKSPIWPELPLQAYEEGAETDPFEDDLMDRAHEKDLVASAPGHLIVFASTSLRSCVTVETYDRRPPMETKGWARVVEVGYHSPDGSIVLHDGLGSALLPDLAAHGKGHYRIRVHLSRIPGKGEEEGAYRLLIMSYPGRGDHVIDHRP